MTTAHARLPGVTDPGPALTADERESRRLHILAAAKEVFGRAGFSATKMGDVASAAKGAVEGAIKGAREVGASAEAAAEAAAEGAVKAARSLGGALGGQVREAVTGTISGVKVILREPFRNNSPSANPSS